MTTDAPNPRAPIWTGELRRGEAPNTVTGFLKDEWGWTVAIHGERCTDGSYRLEATLGDPGNLRVTAIDGEETR